MSSSNTYTLKIDIDDSKIRDIEKRLLTIVTGGQAGGIGSQMVNATGGGSKNSDMMKNIGKLGLIATGVLAIVGIMQKLSSMLIESSPMLSQMLKLLNFGILLILRPIGDFFGFFLRPLIIYFIRSIALPWYRLSRPIMQKLGQFLGMSLVKNIKDIEKTAGTPVWSEGFDHGEGMKNLEATILSIGAFYDLFVPGEYEKTKEAIASLKQFWGDAETWIAGFTFPSLGGLTEKITTWISEESIKLPLFGDFIFQGFAFWIIKGLNLLPSWDSIKIGWDEWVEKNIPTLPTWDTLKATFSGVEASLVAVVEAIKQFFVDMFAKVGLDISHILTDTPTTNVPEPVTPPADSNWGQPHPWLSETPSSDLSNHTKGHGR